MGHETHFCYTTSLQGFGYGDVVHQFEKRCNMSVSVSISNTKGIFSAKISFNKALGFTDSIHSGFTVGIIKVCYSRSIVV